MSSSGSEVVVDYASGSRSARRERHGSAPAHCTEDGQAKQIVKFAPWMIERAHLELPAVRRHIRLVHTSRRAPLIADDSAQTRIFTDSSEV
jgi:hypothetical protein